MTKPPTHIIIIGAGYAGMLAAVRLAGRQRKAIKRHELSITLVNAADVFVERVRLHQVAANQPVAARPIEAMLRGTGVAFAQGFVRTIDPAQQTITVEQGTNVQVLGYDRLLYALGSTINQ